MAYYGLLLVFLLEYVRPGVYYPVLNSIKFGTVWPLFMLVVSLFVNSKNSHANIWQSSVTKWLTYFLFVLLVSWMVMGGMKSKETFNMALGYFFLYYIIARIVDTKAKLKGVMFMLAVVHIILIYLNPKLVTEPETRTYIQGVTFLGDGNDFALSLCVVIPFTFYLLLDTSKKIHKIIYIAAVVICVLAVIGTQSRGASLALGSVLLYLWSKSRNKALGFVALIVLVLAALLFAAPQYFARMGTLANYQEEGSAMGRINAWKAGINMFTHNPIMGAGVGNFPLANGGKTAHSMYFLALGELAIPGMIFLIAFVFGNFRRIKGILKKIDPHDKDEIPNIRMFTYINSSLLGFSVAGAFLSVLYYPHIFVISGLIFTSIAIYTREQQENKAVENEIDEVSNVPKSSNIGRRKI